ncbi:tetratricopeptide repeat protein [Marinobacter sp.]|uniref:tetratricopeptide repeat protein n=1 Tax=Marinobacter sp. TaxID=50741 RepID=UPI0038514E4F
MMNKRFPLTLVGAATLVLAGCATGTGYPIYVPASQEPAYDQQAPEPPQTERAAGDTRVLKSEQPAEREVIESRPIPAPDHQSQGETLSPAAASLMMQADSLLAQGNTQGAISQLERAQRISPRSAEIYYKLSEAYVQMDRLDTAEQFTLKGLSLAGSNTKLQRSGWNLLADIRRANGNMAGANQAEQRASAL